MKGKNAYTTLFWLAALAILAGCASIGRPEGGARDETPPVFVRSSPAQGALNVDRQRIELVFDENIQLDDAFNKVIVSPSQVQAPVVRSQGRRVTVELRDTLVPDATYTIDFGDAIKDLNEGNILDGFAMDFATGNVIDSLRISGVLLEARTLEPAQGMLVGIYSNLADSAITTLPLERVTRTNSRGQFTVRGLKEGQYRVFAINDVNRDNRWDRSEDIAFYDLSVSPRVESIQVSDTLRDSADRDSIVTRPGVAYLPDDILLTWFNEGYQSHYLKDYIRADRRRITVTLSAPYDTVSTARIVNTPALGDMNWNDITVADITPGNDTITWWIKDPGALAAADSLSLALTYPRTDSLDRVVMTTDTLKFFYRPSSDEIKKAKELAKLKEKGADTIPPEQVFMSLRVTSGTSHDIYNPIVIESTTPWASIDTTAIRLSMAVDTLWEPVTHGPLIPVQGTTILKRQLQFTPEPGAKYRLEADSAAFVDIYGNPAKALSHEFTVKTPDQYSTVIFTLTPADTTAIIELLDGSDKVTRTAHVDNTGRAVFTYVNPGTYYARMFLDDNHDGQWTTGQVSPERQPEEVAYFAKKIDARANWDIDLAWDIYEIPVDMQKPYAILKNKPKLKKGEQAPTDTGDEVDEWGNPINEYGTHRNNSTGGFNMMPGGLQQNKGNSSSSLRR